MKKFVVTGGSGFIGACVVEHIRAAGMDVIAPTAHEWRLGAPLPPACDEADAVIHLACAVLKAGGDRAAASALDVQGTTRLLQQHRALRQAGKRGSFIFISSQSAREGAGNDYGRSKWAIEVLLDQPEEIVVRPGLVYDHAGSSVFGVFAALARLPVLPILSKRACIQPIDAHELAEALLRIGTTVSPMRRYALGAPVALTFAETIRAVAKRSKGRVPLGLPFPAVPVRALAALLDYGLGLSPPLLERIDGLLALRPMETRTSLEAIGLTLANLADTTR